MPCDADICPAPPRRRPGPRGGGRSGAPRWHRDLAPGQVLWSRRHGQLIRVTELAGRGKGRVARVERVGKPTRAADVPAEIPLGALRRGGFKPGARPSVPSWVYSRALNEASKLDNAGDGGVAGQTPRPVIEDVLAWMVHQEGLGSAQTVFLDIGSGAGNVMAAVAGALPRLGAVVGVESKRGLAQLTTAALCDGDDSVANRIRSRAVPDARAGVAGEKPVGRDGPAFRVFPKTIVAAVEDGDLDCVTHAFSFGKGQGRPFELGCLLLIARAPTKLRCVVLNWDDPGPDLAAALPDADDPDAGPDAGAVVSLGGRQRLQRTNFGTGKFVAWRVTPSLRARVAEYLQSVPPADFERGVGGDDGDDAPPGGRRKRRAARDR